MSEYQNEGVANPCFNAGQQMLAELQSLFGLYPRTKDVRSVNKFMHNVIPDIKLDEMKSFVSHWAGSDKNHSPDHKEIKKFVTTIRMRSEDIKDFEPNAVCPLKKCDGGGFIVGIRDLYKYIYTCDCNVKSDIVSRLGTEAFETIIGERYGR